MARDRYPYLPFYLHDYMHSRAVQAMTWDQQGRYVWSWGESWPTDTPGMAHEDEWRKWMRYTQKQWVKNRDAMARAFTVRPDGIWIQERLREEAEKVATKRTRLSVIGRAGSDRRWGVMP